MKASPTSRTLAECRKRGGIVAVVERWNPHAMIRQDLFGFIDLLWIRPDGHLVGIQACAAASHAARRDKTASHPNLIPWCASPARSCEVWSWGKKGARGKRKLWSLRVEPVEPISPSQQIGADDDAQG